MGDTTPPRFDYLARLPPEICGMIFAFMVQNTIQTNFRKRQWGSSPELEISDVKSHLISSSWATLNKQYCIEYLKVLLRKVELQGQITKSGKRSLGSDITELRDCLKLIKHRLEIAGRPQTEDEALFYTSKASVLAIISVSPSSIAGLARQNAVTATFLRNIAL
ncbi:hypothetical protein KCU83_g1432, partial [Aureobasidium melanogenum]